jgi:hypothetical protein
MTEVHNPDEYTYYSYNLGQHVTKVVELPFEGCFFINLRSDGLVDVTNCGLLASEDNGGFGVTIYNGSTLLNDE